MEAKQNVERIRLMLRDQQNKTDGNLKTLFLNN